MKGIFNILLREKPYAILNVLRKKGESYISEIARETKCTYAHTRKILLFLEKKGLINFEKEGRIHKINLTEKGEKIAEHIEKIKELLTQNV